MNFELSHIPDRTAKPRESGVTMVMDKGLSLREAEDLISVADGLIDIIKLGFGTAYLTKDLKAKVDLYHKAGFEVYLGGTLFEAFLIRNEEKNYFKLIDDLELKMVEVSDGSIELPHERKCEFIRYLSKDRKVMSEVGSKEAGIIINSSKWKSMMVAELEAGSWKVIAEARESGNVGIYRPNGSAHEALVGKILAKVPADRILWEAPQKAQQVWFINLLGANVNLGNIAPHDVIPLETLRLGIRGDTFFNYLPDGQDLKPTVKS